MRSGSGASGRREGTARPTVDMDRTRRDDAGVQQSVVAILRKLALWVVVSAILAGCGDDAVPAQAPAPLNTLVAERLFQAISSDASSHDLFFGAFMLGDSIFAGRDDQLRCFTGALTEELEGTGPAATLDRLTTWAQASATLDRDSLVGVLNDSSFEERLEIGSAANRAIERCGGLLEAVIAAGAGPSYSSCQVESADRADARDLFVVASIEMSSNPKAEFGPETTMRFEQYELSGLEACFEGIDSAREEWAATSTTEMPAGGACGEPGSGYGYIKVDQEWYTSARSGNTEPEMSYHARVWGERETWIAGDGTGRNHQVTHGPGFDSFDDADAWLALGAREPLETEVLTHDVALESGTVRVIDLPCLAGLSDAEARGALAGLGSSGDAFAAVLDELRHRGGMPADARAFAVQSLQDLAGVMREDGAVDSLGRAAFRLWIMADGPDGTAERHEALFEPSTNRLLEHLTIAVAEPVWTVREVPFATRRETVLAEGHVESAGDLPNGVSSIDDPHRGVATAIDDQLFRILPAGLSCVELIDAGASYSEVVAYWVVHEKPSSIDGDRDGMPCDDDYDERSVEAFWPEPPS